MAELIHVSRAKIIKDKGPARRAYIESFPEPAPIPAVDPGLRARYISTRSSRVLIP